MNHHRKVCAAILAVCFGLAACGAPEQEAQTASAEAVELPTQAQADAEAQDEITAANADSAYAALKKEIESEETDD
ncbi:MAG: hypothetical protein HN712_20175 [Gemmatimonadetes bacterium]|nr:hypothetical protein [Gemmatimonadota bacterium]MBT6147783.1 hypothetical protein [Gemmatimonadota bacterium]MBT7862643.1 hypothetical protein [Gemmatimonadota bacterium]